jgi:hypothetical protein
LADRWDDLLVDQPGKGRPWGVASLSYKGHRYPVEVISHCVWLYFRFPLSFREVEELMLERGVVVSYETVRRWCGGRPTPTRCAAGSLGLGTSGTWTRSSSRSTASRSTCGAMPGT